jgi:3'-phosphoadenosine 5'-phosphosulfate sulfotransferase (PAPS reductase)/FAD synthetase
MSEPLLNAEDRRIWERWRRVCLLHARTAGYRRRVEKAREHIAEMGERCPSSYLAWSAGKDSTAMVHIATEVLSEPAAMSIKDDCDFPGEEEYVSVLAKKWGVRLDVVIPQHSMQERLAELAITPGDDIHSRSAKFSDESFYSLIEEYRRKHGLPGVYLGIRKDESYARLMHRASRGAIYTKRDGETVCMPICDWSDKDIYAYLFANEVELFPVYRCVRLAKSPAAIRKSWWVPGSAARYGQMIWLKSYYPSLYNKVRELMPGASIFA